MEGDGCQLVRHVRENDLQGTVRIALAGFGEGQHPSLEAEFAFHLLKPVDPDDLLGVLTQHCHKTKRTAT